MALFVSTSPTLFATYAAVALAALSLPADAQVLQATWARNPVLGPGGRSNPWAAREGPALHRLNASGTVLLIGGANATGPLADVWGTTDLINWHQVAAATPFLPRTAPSSACNGATVLLTGGRNASGLAFNDAWSSADGGNWTRAGASVWPGGGRFGHAMAWLPSASRWFTVGGISPTGSVAFADVYGSADAGSTWTAVTAAAPWPARGFASLAPFLGSLFLLGGVELNLGTVHSDAWRSVDGASWVPVPVPASPAWTGRYDAGLVSAGGVLWVLGGRGDTGVGKADSFLGDIWRTDETGSSWGQVEDDAPWGPRSAFGLLSAPEPPSKGTLILVAGRRAVGTSPGVPVVDVWLSTGNLLCEANSTVCSGRGDCLLSWSRYTRVGGAEGWRQEPPPLPVNCSCDSGYEGPRCTDRVCNAATCVHGSCVPVPGEGKTCVCSDPSEWTGSACADAICAPGCGPHGSCVGAPGACNCAVGWTGHDCVLLDTWLVVVGAWMSGGRAGAVWLAFTSVGLALLLVLSVWSNVAASRPPFPAFDGRRQEGVSAKAGREGATLFMRSRHGEAVSFAAGSGVGADRVGGVGGAGGAVQPGGGGEGRTGGLGVAGGGQARTPASGRKRVTFSA
jgi:hypothetical protein